ncbi:MAG: tetratricopeptide repeat protein [Planctomycetes bacterium]|nr:tetratricopeptide repeat protein [Planctomycetota bacterium]
MSVRRRLGHFVLAVRSASIVCLLTVLAWGQAGDSPAERESRVRQQMTVADTLRLEGMASQGVEAYTEIRLLTQGRAALADLRCRATMGMADCLWQLDQSSKARDLYLEVVGTSPTCSIAPEALLRAGRITQWELDDPVKARSLYEKLLADFPTSPQAGHAALLAAETFEYEKRFDDALKAYDALTLKHAADASAAVIVEKAREAIRFLKINRGEDDAPLVIYRHSERLARHESTRNAALLELINLTGRHAESPLVDDALVLMLRTYLAKGDQKAARETFDRLVKIGPRNLSADAVRFVASRAAAWLISDVDAHIERVAEVFPELAGYGRSELGWKVPTMVTLNADDQRTLVYDTGGAANAPRRLTLRIVVGPPTKDKPAVYPALGLYQQVVVETPNEVLKQEIMSDVETMVGVLRQLDRAAYLRAEGDFEETAATSQTLGAGR